MVSLPVRVSGIDYNNNPFTQTAQTVDISRTGARLSGVSCLRGVGEMVTIECGPLAARFLVVWIGRPGSSEDGLFGVKALQPEKRIFGVDTGEERPDLYLAPAEHPPADPFAVRLPPKGSWDHSERRKSHRIRCFGTAQIRQPGVAFPIWAKLADLSSGGCYVEMVFTMPRATALNVLLTIGSRNFCAKGTVVTSHPGVGIGIKFTEITQDNQKLLAEILQELTAAKAQHPKPDSQTSPAP